MYITCMYHFVAGFASYYITYIPLHDNILNFHLFFGYILCTYIVLIELFHLLDTERIEEKETYR